jgi:hypothetical protein
MTSGLFVFSPLSLLEAYMDVFDFRNRLIAERGAYLNSFINVRNSRIQHDIQDNLEAGHLLLEPPIQLNPSFESCDWIDFFQGKCSASDDAECPPFASSCPA